MVVGTTIKLKWRNKMIWICEYCGAEIESRRKLYKHKRDEHNIRNGSQKKYNFICEYCLSPLFLTKASFANHKRYCKENPNKQPGTFRGKKHTHASKSKISESMHNAALIGKNRGWTTSRVGDERKSYPEVFFTKVIENEFSDKDRPRLSLSAGVEQWNLVHPPSKRTHASSTPAVGIFVGIL